MNSWMIISVSQVIYTLQGLFCHSYLQLLKVKKLIELRGKKKKGEYDHFLKCLA